MLAPGLTRTESSLRSFSPKRFSCQHSCAAILFLFQIFSQWKKLRGCWIRAVPGTRGGELSFPFSCRAKLFRAKGSKRKERRQNVKYSKSSNKNLKRLVKTISLFFAVLYKLMRRPALMQNVDIITEKSREKFVPVWKRRWTWRHGVRSESGGHDESNKGKIWIARHRRVPPRRAGREPLLRVDIRVLSRFPTFLSMFFFPESGNANEGTHTPITRNLFPENCQFNESRLIVYVYSTHQH